MAFFDDSFMKDKREENIDIYKNMPNQYNVLRDNNSTNNDGDFTTNSELLVNKKNREEYQNLMENSKSNYDMFYDKNNFIVKIVMLLLGLIIVCGVIYYVILFFTN